MLPSPRVHGDHLALVYAFKIKRDLDFNAIGAKPLDFFVYPGPEPRAIVLCDEILVDIEDGGHRIAVRRHARVGVLQGVGPLHHGRGARREPKSRRTFLCTILHEHPLDGDAFLGSQQQLLCTQGYHNDAL